MGRPRKFDRDTVVGKAMDVFWAKGFGAASMEDLVGAMGINRGSLYAAFGDKRRLHLASLDYFQKTELGKMLAPLAEPGSRFAAIRAVFETAAKCGGMDGSRRGCLLYNTAVELCPDDTEVLERVALGMKYVEDAFFQALIEARAARELTNGRDPRALARYLTNCLNGLRVMCLVFTDEETRRDIVETSLDLLE